MVSEDNKQPDDLKTVQKKSVFKEGVERSVLQNRRRNFLGRFYPLLIFSIFFVTAILYVNDLHMKNNYVSDMAVIRNKIVEFHTTTGRYPSKQELGSFNLETQTIKVSAIDYELNYILPDSQPDTLLASSPRSGFWLVPEGRMVLFVNGEMEWLTEDEYKGQVKLRKQRNNSSAIKDKDN